MYDEPDGQLLLSARLGGDWQHWLAGSWAAVDRAVCRHRFRPRVCSRRGDFRPQAESPRHHLQTLGVLSRPLYHVHLRRDIQGKANNILELTRTYLDCWYCIVTVNNRTCGRCLR